MLDTIDLLEAIGRNAGLRYASTEQLTHALEQADASDALMAAVASGDATPLSESLGQMPMHLIHHSQTPAHEEEQEEDEEHEQKDPDPNLLSHD